jgi:GNAT superfamily N-acetyltransferase
MEAAEADLAAFQKCFAKNGTVRELDALRWQYVDNPAAGMFVDLALCGDRFAAIYAVQPGMVKVEDNRTLAAQSVDTLVDADFRGRGLFTTMAQALYQRLAQNGGRFVYGFPNANSAPGFFGKLGWMSLDPVPFLIRPLRTAFLASKLPLGRWLRKLPDLRLPMRVPKLRHRYAIHPVAEFGPEVDGLWNRFSSDVPVAVERDSEYLKWRLAKPGERYECLGVLDEGALVAFCAYTTVAKHGGKVGYVLELLHGPEHDDAAAALLVEALRRMATEEADAVLAWCFQHSPNAGTYRRAGFFPLPEALRPIELHFGVRPLDESLRPLLVDRRNWYISYCDSDTV